MKKYYSCDCMCHELVKAKFSNLKCHEKILKSITDDNSKIRKVVSVWMTLALLKFITDLFVTIEMIEKFLTALYADYNILYFI